MSDKTRVIELLHLMHNSFKTCVEICNATSSDFKISCMDGLIQYSKLLIAVKDCYFKKTFCSNFSSLLLESDLLIIPHMTTAELIQQLDCFYQFPEQELAPSISTSEVNDCVSGTKVLVNVQDTGSEILEENSQVKSFCFQCNDCFKIYTSEKKLYYHYYNVHHVKKRSLQLKHTCQDCLKQFSTESDLSKHLENCAGKQFKCVFQGCASKFKRKADLVFHNKVKHLVKDVKNINICRHCGQEFYSSSNLNRHILKFHS